MMVIKDPTLFELFKGELPLTEWKFQLTLLFIGLVLRVLLKIANREEKTVSPSFKIWFSQTKNLARIGITAILSYLLIRFFGDYKEYLLIFIPPKINASVYLLIVVLGFYLHVLAERLNKLVLKKER